MDMSKLPRLSQTADAKARADEATTPDPSTEAASAPGTRLCPHCQGVMNANSKFCNDCGASLTAAPSYAAAQNANTGAEAWLSTILGIVFLYLGRTFGHFLLARLTGQPFHTNVFWNSGDNAGSEVAYSDLQGFTALSDAGIFLFGVLLISEAIVFIVLARAARPAIGLLIASLAVTALITLFNLFVVVKLFGAGILPIISLLAFAFGGYIAATQWSMLRAAKANSSASNT